MINELWYWIVFGLGLTLVVGSVLWRIEPRSRPERVWQRRLLTGSWWFGILLVFVGIGGCLLSPSPPQQVPPTAEVVRPTLSAVSEESQARFCDSGYEITQYTGERIEIPPRELVGMLDYYPDILANQVTIILLEKEVATLEGYGTYWEWAPKGCDPYELVTAAEVHVKSLLGEGSEHSGLVYQSLSDYLSSRSPARNVQGINPENVARPTVVENKDR